ncbi:SDR family NAD(P)-dependent oxidoreductase [Variovorax sp. ZT4R33]|uniref:SDR family NAD(P)-dependent oxidoreductase n=1 Tax=Variovorax sp. ZT4R33 TaxID=3443743 RepID=UPI003F46DC9C
MNFDHQIVMLTGASGNLGRAVARSFSDRGAQLVLLDRHPDRLDAAFTAVKHRPLAIQADLTRPGDASDAVAAALARFGRIDVLCNLAGGFRMGAPVHETTPETWDFLFDVNVRSVLHMSAAVVPAMLDGGGGRIVNVGAYAALRGGAGMGPYAASKAAIIRLTESMSAELREHRINVNCVLPTILDTPQNRADMPQADPTRWVAPSELANAVMFLAWEGASAIHGVALPVTGLV